MGVLFMTVGTFSAGLPRSGDWLTRFKYVMGIVVLGFAAWNVRLIVPEWVNYGMWTLVCFTTAGVLSAFEAAEGLVPTIRKAFGMFMIVLGLLFGVKSIEAGLDLKLLPQGGAAPQTAKAETGIWMEQDLEKALAKAKAENKLVLVDTYAEWCAQCKELDHKTWPQADVQAWLTQNAVPVRIDTDKVRPDLAKKLEIRSYPTVILMDANGKELRRSLGFQPAPEMLAFLKK
jgi:thiol:disulfide interchange protein